MFIKNGGAQVSLDSIVLFPFDDHSIPFQDALYISFKNSKKVEVPALERQIDISRRK